MCYNILSTSRVCSRAPFAKYGQDRLLQLLIQIQNIMTVVKPYVSMMGVHNTRIQEYKFYSAKWHNIMHKEFKLMFG
jgi:hypothetical protein